MELQKPVPAIHKYVFPDLFLPHLVTAIFPSPPCQIGPLVTTVLGLLYWVVIAVPG